MDWVSLCGFGLDSEGRAEKYTRFIKDSGLQHKDTGPSKVQANLGGATIYGLHILILL